MQERIVLMLPRGGPGLFFFKETDQNLSTIPPRMPPAKKRMIALAFQIVIQIASFFVLLCLKVFSICANHAAKAVSFSVLALRAANNAVITFRPFSVTM